MIDTDILNVIDYIRPKTVKTVRHNIIKKEGLNIVKFASPNVNLYGSLERTFTTCLGLALQEVAAKCGTNVVNVDKSNNKQQGIDLRTSFGEGQMKLYVNTQSGTHTRDSIKLLRENATKPFFVYALEKKPKTTIKDDIVYYYGSNFWSKIGIDFTDLHDTIVYVIQQTEKDLSTPIDNPLIRCFA